MTIKDFSELPDSQIIGATRYFVVIKDQFPVSPGHLLVISKEVKATYFDLCDEERVDLQNALQVARELCESEYTPDAYNIGMNCGEEAGQTVMHFHCHLIPRYRGDMADPRGGVRHVIPEKGNYLMGSSSDDV